MKLPYDPVKDLAPISLVGTFSFLAVAYPGAGIESVGDLIAKAKARPGGIAFGSPGNGTPHHLAGELLKTMTGANLVHVPYKGISPELTALIGGEIPVAFIDLTAALPYIRSGKIRGLTTTGSRRPGGRCGLADDGRSGAGGLRDHRLVGTRRAGGNAASDRPAVECRGESRGESARGARKTAGSRRRADDRHAPNSSRRSSLPKSRAGRAWFRRPERSWTNAWARRRAAGTSTSTSRVSAQPGRLIFIR